MPSLPAVANVLEVQLKHTVGSDLDVLARIFMAYTGTAPSDTGLTTMAGTVEGAWSTDLKSLVLTTSALTGIVITDLTSSSASRGEWSGSVAGTRSGTEVPASTAFNIGFSIARRYRGGKPKVYMPFGDASDLQTAQTWTSALATSVGTGWAAFVTAVAAAMPSGTTSAGQVGVSWYEGFTSVENPITHRYRNVPTLRATPVTDPVIATVYNTRIATQRRRNGKSL